MQEALFPRYLFIRLGTGMESQSWAPIRSTTGVSRLVTFGHIPAKIDDDLVADMRAHTESSEVVLRHFEPGEQVVVTHGPFVGVEATLDSPPVRISKSTGGAPAVLKKGVRASSVSASSDWPGCAFCQAWVAWIMSHRPP